MKFAGWPPRHLWPSCFCLSCFRQRTGSAPMFTLKICGLTRVVDAELAALARVDAIGLNFYAKSKRYVTLEQARIIVSLLPHGVARVGVFVNHSAEEIRAIQAATQLDYVQLHGDETPQLAAELAPLPIIRGVRCRGVEEAVDAARWVAECRRGGGVLAGVIVDAFHPSEYGGTGQLADPAVFVELRRLLPGTPLLLAGGLTPQNVASAIRATCPDGVDVASGVETSIGSKDPLLMRSFIALAREALEAAATQRS